MTQLAIPVEVNPSEVMRKRSLGDAISLCAELAGKEPKQIQIDGKPIDKGQWSRWTSGTEGVLWQKLRGLMDSCGNDAPLLWMIHERGYDIGSLHKRESELERQLRETKAEVAALRRVLGVAA